MTIPGVIVMLVGLALLGGAGFAWYTSRSFLARAVPLEGIVVRMECVVSKGQRSGVHKPVVEYTTADGVQHRTRSDYGSNPPEYWEGQHVRILVDADDAESFVMDSFMEKWFFVVVFGAIGSVVCLMGAFFLVMF